MYIRTFGLIVAKHGFTHSAIPWEFREDFIKSMLNLFAGTMNSQYVVAHVHSHANSVRSRFFLERIFVKVVL